MTINVWRELALMRAQVREWHAQGLRVALVPTMGNLHAGHHSLIRLASEHADRVVASIFVNPTQFGPNEDFDRYPRTPDADIEGLDSVGCHGVWLPDVAAMYPLGVERAVQMRVPVITETLDGVSRPGHFDGVATVVSRLFNQVQPDVAVFGEKDYQQLAVIRAMVADLSFAIDIIGAPTLREPSGLAMSSRNQYLSASQREQAATIRQTLGQMELAANRGADVTAIQADAVKSLSNAGFDVDYAFLRHPDLTQIHHLTGGDPVVGLIAARLGTTRLIDNYSFTVTRT